MIWDSKPWKDELLASARSLKAIQTRRRSDTRSYRFERTIFVCAYIMRKLSEAEKISTEWKVKKVPCIFYRLRGRPPDLMNWHQIERHFDLDTPESNSLTALDLCHRIIHSFVFVEVCAPKKGIVGFFFASDQTKRRGIWFVEVKDFRILLRETGHEYPSSSRMVRHPKTGEWVVWAGHGSPPSEWDKMADSMALEYASRLNLSRKVGDGS